MINNIKKYVQIFLSDNSYVYKLLRSFYFRFNNKKIFSPLDLVDLDTNILQKKHYSFSKKNFLKFKKDYSFFLISDKRLINKYPNKKLKKIIELAKTAEYELIYDGDCPFNTEIVSSKFLENYSENYEMLIDHENHKVILLKETDNALTYKVFILSKEKKKYSYIWKVEKVLLDDDFKNCWMTTSVSSPEYLGNVI